MKKKSFVIIGVFICLFLMLPVFSPAAFAVEGKEIAEDLDNYFIPAFPIVYGEIINSLPPDQVADISSVLKGVEIFDYLFKIGKIGDSLASGSADMDTALDAATVAASLAIKFMADEATKKILIAGVGVGALPLTALITSIDIARSSSKAVAQSKIALDLEVLYYTVETDSVLKDTNRELGTGNPIKTDQAAVEHLFRKCLRDLSWAALFKTYVTTELGQPWPEPSLWDRLTVDNDFLEEAAILAEKKRLQSHIATLLLELNKVGKKREALVVAAKQMQAIKAMAEKISPEELKKALSLYNMALTKLPAIKEYVAGLPAKVEAYRARIEKTTARDLQKLRGAALTDEMKIIVKYMGIVRYLPTKGKDAQIRLDLLNTLKEGYNSLFLMKTGISTDLVNARIEKEKIKLNIKNIDFSFKRYPCPKFFEDYLSSFETDVKAGRFPSEKLAKVYEEIEKNRRETAESYQKDYAENKKLYEEKLKEFNEKLLAVNQRIAQKPDSKELNRLWAIKIDLQNRRQNLINDFNKKYKVLYDTTSSIDIAQCASITNEIKRYIEVYGNKYKTIEGYLKGLMRDVDEKSGLFYSSHGSGTKAEAYVSENEINRIKEIIRKNSGGVYAYSDLTFLEDLVHTEPKQAVSVNVQKTLEDITAALERYLTLVSNSRMQVDRNWRKWRISQLKYMENEKSLKDIQVVADAVDAALMEYRQVDPDDISESYKPTYKQAIARLESTKTSMAAYRTLRSKASGMASLVSAYLARADEVNERVETDLAYLKDLYLQFRTARESFKFVLQGYAIKQIMTRDQTIDPPPVLPGLEIKKLLYEKGILVFSRKYGLGLEEMFAESFAEIKTEKKGWVILREIDFQNILQGVSRLPVNNMTDYWKEYHKLKNKDGPEGLLMQLSLFGSKFVDMFSFDAKFGKTAKKIIEVIAERKALARKAQAAIDKENNLFLSVLMRVNNLLSFGKTKMGEEMYSSVMGLDYRKQELLDEYKNLKKTRDDVDAAFKELTDLIELAKLKYFEQQEKAHEMPMEEIHEFYAKFKEAYESRNDFQVLSLIHDDWEAGDGTTLADLEMNLSRTFRTFDEINYTIANINASPLPNGRYLVTYDVAITSRMFERNLKHEEKSSVSEEVAIMEDGTVMIVKTLSGRFWTD